MPSRTVLESTGLALGSDSRIDVESGVIKRVKIIGNKSRNRRYYPPALLADRFSVYEGAQVFADHDYGQLKSGKARPMSQWGGVLRGVTNEAAGVYGDLHCLKETTAGRIILEAAARCPDRFGLSPMHLIEARKEKDGSETVTAILECWSVDAVTRPATTRTLFEEELMPDDATPAATPEPSAVPSVEAAFLALQNAVMASDEYDDNEKVSVLKDVMKLKSKILGGDEEEAPDETPAEESHNRPAPVGRTAKRLDEHERSLRGLTIRMMAGEELRSSLDAATMQTLLSLPDDGAVANYLDNLRRNTRRRYSSGPARSTGRTVAESDGSRRAAAAVPKLTQGADREAVKRHYRS